MTAGVLTVQDVITRVQRTFGDESSAQVTQTRSISDSVLHGEEAEAAPIGSRPRRTKATTAVVE